MDDHTEQSCIGKLFYRDNHISLMDVYVTNPGMNQQSGLKIP